MEGGADVGKFDDKQLYKLLHESNLDEIEEFFKKYGLNSVDRDGRTFLMSAVISRKEDIVDFLLKLGVDVNAQDNDGLSALHLGAIHGITEVLKKKLIQYGANIDIQDKWGNTPLGRTVFYKKLEATELLLSYSADIDKENNYGVSPRYLQEKLACPSNNHPQPK